MDPLQDREASERDKANVIQLLHAFEIELSYTCIHNYTVNSRQASKVVCSDHVKHRKFIHGYICSVQYLFFKM